MIEPASEAWSPIEFPPGMLEGAHTAPVAVPEAEPKVYTVALAQLLAERDVPQEIVGTVLSSATIFLYGARQFVALTNRLLSPLTRGSPLATQTIDELISCAGTLSRERFAAYVLRQMGDVLASRRERPSAAAPLRRVRRSRSLLSRLENALSELSPTDYMEPEDYGLFLVLMDGFYDDCTHQLERFADLLSRNLAEARALFPEFLEHLYRHFVTASLESQVLGEEDGAHRNAAGEGDSGDAGERPGLTQLLPRFGSALR